MNDVFISYSRRDKVFTQKLFEALKAANRIVWADWDSIPAASDWDAEIKEGIEQAESVLFLLSPEWIKSNECRKELVHAVTMGKRLIPILYQMVDPNDVPPELAKINWVYMRDTDDFDKAFQTLCAAMDTDLDWVKTHTRIQVRALEWDKKKRENSFVLRGKDLADGEKFITEAAGKSPEPTALQGEYILASRKDAARRQRITLMGVTIALVVSIALGIAAFIQRQAAVAAEATAVVERDHAVSAEATAVAERDRADLNAKMAFARELNAETKNNLNKDPERSLMLALKAVDVTTGAGQPVMMDTYDALRLAVQASRIRYSFSAGNNSVIWSVAFSPKGDRLAAAGDEGTVKIWDMTAVLNSPTGASSVKPVLTLSKSRGVKINTTVFSPDGTLLATGNDSGDVTIWNASSGEEIGTITGNGYGVNQLVFNFDGTRLAVALQSGDAIIWNMETKELLYTLTTTAYANKFDDLAGIGEGVRGLAFSPDGKQLVTARDNQPILIWNAITGSLKFPIYKPCSAVLAVAISSNGKNLAISEACPPTEVVKVIRLDTIDPAFVYTKDLTSPDQIIGVSAHTDIVYKLAFNPDGTLLASASEDNTVSVTDVRDGSTKFTLNDVENVESVAYSPDGKYIASGNAAGQVKLWDASIVGGYESGGIAAQNQAIASLAFSPDGTRIATADVEQYQPIQNIWNIADGEAIQLTLSSSDNQVKAIDNIVFSLDGKKIIAGVGEPENCRIFSWDAASGSQSLTLEDPYCKSHVNQIFNVAYSPDGKFIAAAEGLGRAVIWDAQTGEITHELTMPNTDSYFYSVAFSPDGTLLAVGDENMLATIWEIKSERKLFTLEGHTGWVKSIAFSPDGKQLLTGSTDSSAILWNVENGKGKKILTLSGHAAGINKAAFSPDGTLIASASDDGTAKIWDATTGNLLTTISASAGLVADLAFSPDGKILATGSQDGGVRYYFVTFEDLLAFAKTHITRSFTLEECQTYLHTDQCPASP